MSSSYIEMLPALHGDSFFLYCMKGEEKGIIVVDGGPSTNSVHNPFINEVEKLPQIDLMIMTHHDDDHLIGIKDYITKHKKDIPFPVKKLWVNCARNMDFSMSNDLSASKASKLADALIEINKVSEVSWMDRVVEGYDTSDIIFADIDVLNPSADLLECFICRYEEKACIKEVNMSSNKRYQDVPEIDIEMPKLSKRKKTEPCLKEYEQLANAVSMAFIVRCDDFSLLMLGDTFPRSIVASLEKRGYNKDKKLKVDFVKVAHHGSHNNISNDLLDMIDCDNYIIPTNGGKGSARHPERETLANIICHPERDYNRCVHIHFNYPLRQIQSRGNILINEKLDKNLNFEIHEPEPNTSNTKYRVTKY